MRRSPWSSSDELNDYQLMDLLADAEPRAFELLYKRHSPAVFALCTRMLRDSAAAEEVLQEIFWELWSRADRYDPQRASARAYLITLARSR